MEYLDVINKRRSIRKYKEEEVSLKILEQIVADAILAPSAHNRQPWYFKVLNKEEIIKIGDILLEKKSEKDISIENTANIIKLAPSMILIYSDSLENVGDILSLGAFIEHICLSATSLELGTLWITNVLNVEKEINEYLNIDKHLVSAVVVGYQDQFPNPRPRKSIDEIRI